MFQKVNYLSQIPMIDSECDNKKKPPLIAIKGLAANRSPFRDRQNKINNSNIAFNSNANCLNSNTNGLNSNNSNNNGFNTNTCFNANTFFNSNNCFSSNNNMGFNKSANCFNGSKAFNTSTNSNFTQNNGTPTRGKTSLSPLRGRKTPSSQVNASTSNVNSSSVSQRTPNNFYRNQFYCNNSPGKVAKFKATPEGEVSYFCEKCAIFIASQGFTVQKISQTQPEIEMNPRKREVQDFLKEIENVTSKLNLASTSCKEAIDTGESQYEQELRKVEDYYSQFYEIIDEHKRRVQLELMEEFQNSCKESKECIESISQAINTTGEMKDDIILSMDSIILQADEKDYRSVMRNYRENIRNFKVLLNQGANGQVKVRKLCFKDPQEACAALDSGLHVEWQDARGNESKDKDMSLYSKESQNPVECLGTQENFTKSSLKQIGGLFCSFDE